MLEIRWPLDHSYLKGEIMNFERLVRAVLSEPIAIIALLESGLVLAATFGFGLEPEQVAALMVFSTLLLGVLGRALVKPLVKRR